MKQDIDRQEYSQLLQEKEQFIGQLVETIEQLDFIKSIQCDEAQGYFISKPVPASKLLNSTLEDLLSSIVSDNVKMI